MDSPFSPLRRTVTQHDIKVAKQTINDTEQELKRYNAEINRLKGALLMMEVQRDAVEKRLKERLKGYESMLAPIHRMPQEVLVEVFEFCCGEFVYLDPKQERFKLDFPLPMRLVMVCGRWRDLIISTPSLWARLKIRKHSSPESLPSLHRALTLFIQRSETHPLRLDISYHQGERNFVTDALKALVVASDRWESLNLRTNAGTSRHITLHPIRGRLPNLRRLGLYSSEAIDKDYHEDFRHLFELAPSLRSITLDGGLVTSRLSLPWQQLNSISLGSCTLNRARQILALTPNVEQLTLASLYLESDRPEGHLTLAKLIIFRSAVVRESGFDIFQRLELPNLRVLELTDPRIPMEKWNVPLDISALKNILHVPSSESSLTSLTLCRIPISDRDMISLLRLVPTLTTLILRESSPPLSVPWDPDPKGRCERPCNVTITTPFLRQLLYPDNLVATQDTGKLFLPRLTVLELLVHAEGLDERALVHAILSRSSHGAGKSSSAGSCLKSTDITVSNREPGNTFDVLRSLECLEDAGMEVRIQIFNYPPHGG